MNLLEKPTSQLSWMHTNFYCTRMTNCRIVNYANICRFDLSTMGNHIGPLNKLHTMYIRVYVYQKLCKCQIRFCIVCVFNILDILQN